MSAAWEQCVSGTCVVFSILRTPEQSVQEAGDGLEAVFRESDTSRMEETQVTNEFGFVYS